MSKRSRPDDLSIDDVKKQIEPIRDHLVGRLNADEQIIQNLLTTLKTSDEQVTSLNQRIKNLESEFQTRIANSEIVKQRLEEQLNSLNRESQELRGKSSDQVQAIQKELETSQKQLETVQKTFQETVQQLQEELRNLRGSLEKENETNQTLRETITQLTSEQTTSTEQIQKIDAFLNYIQSTFTDMQKEELEISKQINQIDLNSLVTSNTALTDFGNRVLREMRNRYNNIPGTSDQKATPDFLKNFWTEIGILYLDDELQKRRVMLQKINNLVGQNGINDPLIEAARKMLEGQMEILKQIRTQIDINQPPTIF